MISMKINHRCLVPFRVEMGKLLPKHKAVIEIVLLTTWVIERFSCVRNTPLNCKREIQKIHSTECIALLFMGEVGEETLVC